MLQMYFVDILFKKNYILRETAIKKCSSWQWITSDLPDAYAKYEEKTLRWAVLSGFYFVNKSRHIYTLHLEQSREKKKRKITCLCVKATRTILKVAQNEARW